MRNLLCCLLIAAPAIAHAQGKKELTPKDSFGFKPLMELGADKYKGEAGGLYGDGKNEPPSAHAELAKKAAAKIQPLDADGKPSPNGKVGLLAIGMSNTNQAFGGFMDVARRDTDKSANVVLINAAQGGVDARRWAGVTKAKMDPWELLAQRLKQANVTEKQVQVIWIKHGNIGPAQDGEFPKHAKLMTDQLGVIVRMAKEKCPNAQLCFVSNRTYGGYSKGSLNPEPYAYENAFSVKWLIDAQIKGDKELNADPDKGAVKAPVLLWGAYLWADGKTARKDNGFTWQPEDVGNDGTHQSGVGSRKIGELMLTFFKNDPYSKPWFVKGR